MARLAFIIIALFLSCAALSEASCYGTCRFQFCDGTSTIKAKPDVSLTVPICLRDGKPVGIVNTGEALLRRRRFVRISKYMPHGLLQNFSSSFFKTYNVRVHSYGRKVDRSGVGHETPQQNQIRFLNNKCWILPVTAYQVLNERGYVIDNKHPNRPLVDCIAFKTVLV